MVKKKTYNCERIFKVVCFLFPVWILSQFMAIVHCMCFKCAGFFSLFYKANVMQQCQWSYLKLGPIPFFFFSDTYICKSLPILYATNGKLNMTLTIFNSYVLAHTV